MNKGQFEAAPGVLNDSQLRSLAEIGSICNLASPGGERDYDASAFDLRLGTEAWKLSDGQRPTTKELSKIQSLGKKKV